METRAGDNTVPAAAVYKEPIRSIKDIAENLREESGDKYPGLVIAVVGEKTSFVPKPWNITRFTSELLSTVGGVNNYWIIYNNNQSLTYYLESAFDIERRREASVENADDSYFVIMPNQDTTKPKKYKRIGDCKLPDLLNYLREQQTTLIGYKSDNTNFELKMKVPVVMIVAEGDLEAAEQINGTIKHKLPVLLINGSGKMADLISNDLLKHEDWNHLKKKAALLLGLFFQKEKMNALKKQLETVKESQHLINVYDLNSADVKLKDFVVESIIAAWSLEGEEGQETWKKTVTMNILDPDQFKNKPLMEIYQTELKPGSSSLYFYLAYQYIQENENPCKETDLKLLLVEAILANRVEYVSAMLQTGVKFNFKHLDILYDEGLKCPSCKAKDCIQIHSVHHRESSSITKKIWCTCGKDCKLVPKPEGVTCDKATGCECLRHDSKSGSTLCQSVGIDARELCNELLYFVQDTDSDRSTCCSKVSPETTEEGDEYQSKLNLVESEREKEIFHDLLIWSLYSNKPDLAAIFWSRCHNQLLTALMASALLKNMAETTKSLQNRKLHEQLLQQSKAFHDRVIEMQNTLYEDNEEDTMTLMHEESTVWDIKTSPMKFAFENKMIDIIGHPCVQRKMNRIWYNNPDIGESGKNKTAASANLSDCCKGFFCCCCCCWMPDCTSIPNAFLSPVTVFIVHYLLMFGLLVAFSAFLLTDLKIIQSYLDVSWYEWTLYGYLIADWIEHSLYPSLIRKRYRFRRKHTFWFKTKRFFTDLWEVFRWFSYIVMISAVLIRLVNSEDLHRATLRLYSLGLFFVYIRFLQCMIVNSYLGPKLIMIAEMLWELLKFIWILILFMLCAGVLYHANMFPNHYDMFPNLEYTRIWKIISLPYWQIYGELFLEELKGENNSNGSCTFEREEWEANPGELERCVEYDWALLIIAALYFLFTNLLLVNLLIAIFSNEYEEININSDRLWKFSRYSIITKFEDRCPVPLNVLWMFVRIFRKCQTCCIKCCNKESGKKEIILKKEQRREAENCLYQERTKKNVIFPSPS